MEAVTLPTGLLEVTLGLALPDKTWIEQDVRFKLGLDWEDWPGFNLAEKAMDQFCDQSVNRDNKTAYQIAEEAGQIRFKYVGFFLIGWNWVDEEGEKGTIGNEPGQRSS